MTQQPPPQSPQPSEGAPEPTATQPSATEPTQEPTVQLPSATEPTTPLGYDQTQEQPLWYDKAQEQPRYAAYPSAAPYSPTEPRPPVFTQQGTELAQPAKPRRLTELAIVAALAAVLASGGTYALTRGDVAASPPVQSSSNATTTAAPVVQANADAPNWAVTAAAVSPSVVAIKISDVNGPVAAGSGVIFDTSGHILTNDHVATAGGQGSQLTVTLSDNRTYDATIQGTDPSTDLAVIKLTHAPNDLKPIALGDAQTLKVGQPVMAVGNPLELAGTVTTGIVSALNRPVTTTIDQQPNDPLGQQSATSVVTNAIQTSAAINPGNSGGALVTADGRLIGIPSAIASVGSSGTSSQSGNIGIGFAIPVNEAESIAKQLIASGTAQHSYLGVSSKNNVVTDGSSKRSAAVVVSVVAGTPADKAGLQAGDAIIAIDGNTIDGSKSLVAQVRERAVGDKVVIRIVRNGQTKDLSATLTSKPATNQ